MKRATILILVFLLIFVFFGCSDYKSTDKKSLLKFNLASEPSSIDPQMNNANDGASIINNTFEGLMRYVDGQLVKGIAQDYQISEDGTVYTFKLRHSLWSDGKPLTANDFVYAWKRGCNPTLEPQPCEYAYQFFYIKGAYEAFTGTGTINDIAVKAIDDYTLEVELTAPTPYFLDLLALFCYMPVRQDVVEMDPSSWARNPKTAIVNGPFKLKEYHIGNKIVLEKNENYWQSKKVKIDTIDISMMVEESTMLSAYEAGEVDIIEDVPVQEIKRLKEEDSTFYILPSTGTFFYVFNTEKEPFDDVRVRKALAYTIDRQAIVENISQGGEQAATGFVPTGFKDVQGRDFREIAGDYDISIGKDNIELAKDLLKEAGYPEGKDFPHFELIYNAEAEAHKLIAEAVQEMWREHLGIHVTIQNMESGVFIDTLSNKPYDIAKIGYTGDYSDPMTMLDIWLSYSGMNLARWENKEFDRLIETSKTLTGKDRYDMLYQAEKLLMEDMAVIPIYYYTNTIMVKEHVKNWELNPLGIWFFGFASIEE